MQVAQSQTRVKPRPASNLDRTEIKVLIVDDSADDYKAICRLLSRLEGYTVTTTRASTGLAARSGVAMSHYDVLIADYRLGPETGADVIRSISRHRPEIAPILVSGNLSPDVQKAALAAGAIHCIDKDWLTTKTLERAIRTALDMVQELDASSKAPARPRWLH